MAWLHIPSTALPFAPVPAGLNSPSTSPNPPIELCVTSSGKPMLRPLSWRGWKLRNWIRLLSGTTLPASTADLGVASWISSLRDTRASLSAPPASGAASKTPATCGPTSPASSATSSPAPSSWKTSPTIYAWDSAKSSMTWDAWVTALRQDSLRRRKSARAMSAFDCSSWPTMSVADSHGHQYTRDKGKKGAERPTLVGKAANWPTPKALSGGANSKRADRNAGGPDLQEMVQSWPTPAARDWRAPNSQDSQDRRNAGTKRGQQLPNFVEHGFPCLPQGQPPTSGSTSSASTRRLNPRFVEWLMGWPTGWTDCDCAGTGFNLWLERSRSALSDLLCRPSIEADGQLNLFGEAAE